jgi:predicted amidohydrolase
MNSLTLSLGQISIEIGQPLKNLEKAATMLRSAAAQHSRMILFPELWTSGYDLANSEKYALINAEIEIQLQALAEELNIIIGGSFITADSSGFHNTFKLIHPGQKQDHPYYNKIHLFRLLAEDQWFVPGQKPTTIEYPWAKTGLSICYDLRFPELYRKYQAEGIGLGLNVAQWGAARRDHWRALLQARAIENQCFMAAADACGMLRDKGLAGSSMIVSPWGDILAEASPDEEELLTLTIDFDQLEEVRHRVPVEQDNQRQLYAGWYTN